jgi:hypothetical protein
MRNVSRILSMVLAALWLAGCAHDTENLAQATVGKRSKQPRRYLNIPLDTAYSPSYSFPKDARSIDDALYSYGPSAVDALKPYFRKAGVTYPPHEIVLIAIKDERKMELWARDNGKFKLIRPYTIKAASGMRGPKLRQGDRQVPEGIYHISRLNPNSNYHLSMKVDYPNEFDLAQADYDGRGNLGGDIFIHGKNVSAGCLAMGDAAIEELFVLAAHVGTDNIKVVIAPSDPRQRPLDASLPHLPVWTSGLYQQISREIFSITQAKPPIKLAHSSPLHPLYRVAN